MRFKLFMQVRVEARDVEQATEWAVKLEELLKNPMAGMAIKSAGIQVIGEPVALRPKQE